MIRGTKNAVSAQSWHGSHLYADALRIADNPNWNVELRWTIVSFVNSFSTPQIPLSKEQVENSVVLMSSFG